MSYHVKFRTDALREWNRLERDIQQQFAKKLKTRTETGHTHADQLKGMPHGYKIKLRSSGFILAYHILNDEFIVAAVAIGKRGQSAVYKLASKRLR